MNRREQIESIIVGTLLNSDETANYFADVKSVISSDMFVDSRRGRIYNIVAEMNAKGIATVCPYSIYEYLKCVIDAPILVYMTELAADWHFLAKKVEYNEWIWMTGQKRYTNVMFNDYIKRFVQLVYGR